MGHEIFFKIFDGPEIFFMFCFRKEVEAQNIQTSHQEDLRKTRRVK